MSGSPTNWLPLLALLAFPVIAAIVFLVVWLRRRRRAGKAHEDDAPPPPGGLRPVRVVQEAGPAAAAGQDAEAGMAETLTPRADALSTPRNRKAGPAPAAGPSRLGRSNAGEGGAA